MENKKYMLIELVFATVNRMVPPFYIVVSPNRAFVTAPRMWRMHLISDPYFIIVSNEIF